MSFSNWLRQNTVRDDAVGDFAQDAGMDFGFPATGSKDKVRNYLQLKGACELALDAFDAAWTEYESAT